MDKKSGTADLLLEARVLLLGHDGRDGRLLAHVVRAPIVLALTVVDRRLRRRYARTELHLARGVARTVLAQRKVVGHEHTRTLVGTGRHFRMGLPW